MSHHSFPFWVISCFLFLLSRVYSSNIYYSGKPLKFGPDFTELLGKRYEQETGHFFGSESNLWLSICAQLHRQLLFLRGLDSQTNSIIHKFNQKLGCDKWRDAKKTTTPFKLPFHACVHSLCIKRMQSRTKWTLAMLNAFLDLCAEIRGYLIFTESTYPCVSVKEWLRWWCILI